MSSFFNAYKCPKCSNPIPFFIRPSMRIRRGLLSPDLRCSHCGQISRQTINVSMAAWIWPLAAGLLFGLIYILRSFIYHETPIFYILLVIGALFLFFIALRNGQRLVPIEEALNRQRVPHKWIIPASGILIFAVSFGYYTGDWNNVVLSVSIGFIIWAVYYYFSANRSG